MFGSWLHSGVLVDLFVFKVGVGKARMESSRLLFVFAFSVPNLPRTFYIICII